VREIFDRAISQRGPMLVAAICFFFSPARHLTRLSGTELLPHRIEFPEQGREVACGYG
jgi:hypothetical protein